MRKSVFVLLTFIVSGSSLFVATPLAQTSLVISNIAVSIVKDIKLPQEFLFNSGTRYISTRHFVVIVIPDDKYSRKNLDTIWQHFKQMYPDRKETLDLKFYTSSAYDYNKEHFADESWLSPGIQLLGLRDDYPRECEAMFEREDVAITDGEDQEIMVYVPDLSKPLERKYVLLAGKDPWK